MSDVFHVEVATPTHMVDWIPAIKVYYDCGGISLATNTYTWSSLAVAVDPRQ